MIVEESKVAKMYCPVEMAGDHDYRCQGSRCMAWRWADVRNPDYVPANPMQYPPPLPWDNPLSVKSTTHGYCGLAGRP